MTTDTEYVPDDPAAVTWDVIVIGTGMGGSTVGYELAKSGQRVLFLEKGLFLQPNGQAAAAPGGQGPSDDSAQARLQAGHWPERLQGSTTFGDMHFYAPLGCGTGGSTLLYAAGLERFSPTDFTPRANYPDVADSTLPERWPISYEELQPFYEKAETLYRVRGTPDPLGSASTTSLLEPPALSARDQHLCESFQSLGLHPYRVHVGYEFVSGCQGCTEGRCLRSCKSDAAHVALLPALRLFQAKILAECEVFRLEADRHSVTQVVARWRGAEISIKARAVVLAAGAYMSPVILLNSKNETWPNGLANESGMVGRNLMFHVSDFIAVAPLKRLSGEGPAKSLAMNDFYASGGKKLGTFQTLGAAIVPGQIMQYMRDVAQKDRAWWKKLASPHPVWWRKISSPVIRLVALVLYHAFNFKNAAIWATIVEDLPYRDNRVIADPNARNGMRFEYRYTDELKQRVQAFRNVLAKALAPHQTIVLSRDNNINFGHVCGTCRFGDDPATSVLDKNNRAHGLSNLYVVDASFFPSSGGTNPSLTIAANALRVAGAIHSALANAPRA
ncbi:MAG: GMC family oxidoreductase [Rhizobacter sp.]|nr:GMC family oxidoreductase [Rhizobacter sp.]